MSIPSLEQLKRALQIVEEIQTLKSGLDYVFGREPAPAAEPTPKKKFTMSAEAREKIGAAQKARWAARNETAKPEAAKPEAKKRVMSEAGRAAIIAAQKKRWENKQPVATVHAEAPAVAAPAVEPVEVQVAVESVEVQITAVEVVLV